MKYELTHDTDPTTPMLFGSITEVNRRVDEIAGPYQKRGWGTRYYNMNSNRLIGNSEIEQSCSNGCTVRITQNTKVFRLKLRP